MLIRSMLYHRKPLFWMFVAVVAVAIVAGVWLLVRSPVQNAGNQHDEAMRVLPPADQSYPLTIISGQNELKVTGYVTWYEKDGVSGDGVQISRWDITDSIEYITIDPDREGSGPFTPYIRGKEVYGQYRLYDEAFTEIDFFTPSGLAPQTYLLKDCEPGRYIVSFETSFEDEDACFGYRYYFGVIVTEEDNAVAEPGEPAPSTEGITLELYQDGEYVQSATIKDSEKVQIVRDAVLGLLVQSSLCEGVDVDNLDDYIIIHDIYQTGFYVYDLDGEHYIQGGRDDFCKGISPELYTRLYDLAVGYLPEDMTVTRGVENITVPGLITYKKEPGKPEIETAGYVITPGYDDLPAVLYTEDMALTIGDTPVHIVRGDPEADALVGLCSVYDAKGNWIPYPEAMTSSIAPYFVKPEIPGHYIVMVLFQEGDGDSLRHTQYVFAIDIVQ